MIYVDDIITTNYARFGETYRVIRVERDCLCGRWSQWPLISNCGRQRLPHTHIIALDERGERNGWNGMIEREGRLVCSRRMWVRTDDENDDSYQRIHPEILVVQRAEQGSLF